MKEMVILFPLQDQLKKINEYLLLDICLDFFFTFDHLVKNHFVKCWEECYLSKIPGVELVLFIQVRHANYDNQDSY